MIPDVLNIISESSASLPGMRYWCNSSTNPKRIAIIIAKMIKIVCFPFTMEIKRKKARKKKIVKWYTSGKKLTFGTPERSSEVFDDK